FLMTPRARLANYASVPIAREDQPILVRAKQAAQTGKRFRQLFEQGDWRGAGYRSQSEADLALCGLLAFWTGRDATDVDRLFRSSALMREKWDENAGGGETYGTRTIAWAIPGAQDTARPARNLTGTPAVVSPTAPVVDEAQDATTPDDEAMDEFLNRDFPSLPAIID